MSHSTLSCQRPQHCTASRKGSLLGWLLPSALLAILPKCPMCFAVYIAMATGLGLSLSTATALRTSLIVLCLITLSLLTIRLAVRLFSPRELTKTVAD